MSVNISHSHVSPKHNTTHNSHTCAYVSSQVDTSQLMCTIRWDSPDSYIDIIFNLIDTSHTLSCKL